MRTVFFLAVCAILTLTFFTACDRSSTKSAAPDPYPDTRHSPDTLLTPTDSLAIVTALDWLTVQGIDYGITDPQAQLRLIGVSSDTTGQASVHFEQIYQGVSVYLNFVFLRIHDHDDVELTWMSFDPDVSLDMPICPGFTEEEAVEKFLDINTGFNITEVDHSDLFVRDFSDGYHLCWSITGDGSLDCFSAEFWFDAHTGNILQRGYITCD